MVGTPARGTTVIEASVYREVMGHYPTGVAVVTGFEGERPIGMVVGTFSAVSLEPPLVAFMPTVSSGTYARLASSPAYCINVLAHDQLELCRRMAVPRDDKFDGVEWSVSELGAPVLADAVAHIHCTMQSALPAGDHLIVLCEVHAMEVTRPVTPLLFFQGGYGGFSPRGMAAQGDADLIAAVRLADPARPHIERLAQELECEAAVLVGVNDDELTTAMSSYGGSAAMRERLGDRIPLMPPIGEAYIAGQPEEVVERWLSKASSQDPDVIEKYRQRLDVVAARGAALATIAPDDHEAYRELHEAMFEYSSGALTPARERAVREVIARMSTFFATVDLTDSELYDVGSVVVPVRNPEGDISMVVRLTQLPGGVSGRTVEGWITRLKEAASAIEAELRRNGGAKQLDDYRAWYPSEFPM
jgi:flavin reductase (DIM6/NTAB) family NADH-FMN oxidoreductase RutF/DNA-binding IclR family transcriptional regulator